MKRILLWLMMYGSCAQAIGGLGDFVRFRAMEAPQQWAQLGLLFRALFLNGDVELPALAMVFPLHQVEQPDDEDEHLLKDQRRAQNLEARENAKRALLASRRHDNHLTKKNKWVCQQPRYNKNNH